MNEEIYRLLNEIDSRAGTYETDAPTEDETAAWKKAFAARRKASRKKTDGKKPRRSRYAAAAAAALLLAAGMSYGPFRERVQAQSESVVYSLAHLLDIGEDLSPYTTVVGSSVENEGISVTLNEVLLDGQSLYVSYLVKLSEDADGDINNLDLSKDLRINGKSVSFCSGAQISQIDSRSYTAVEEISLDTDALKAKNDMKITFSAWWNESEEADGETIASADASTDIAVSSDDATEAPAETKNAEVDSALPDGATEAPAETETAAETESADTGSYSPNGATEAPAGEAENEDLGFYSSTYIMDDEIPIGEFAFSVSGEELAQDTVTIALGEKCTMPDGSVLIFEKYSANSIGKKITFSYDGTLLYDLLLKGEDSSGNAVSFYASDFMEDGGRMVEDLSEEGGIADDAASVTLTPYVAEIPEEDGEYTPDYKKCGETFTISLK